MKKRKPGRPTKLTPEIQDKICDYLKMGNFIDTSCKLVGIHKDTFFEWMKRGREAKRKSIYQDFFFAVEEAQGFGEARHVAIVSKAGEFDWHASAWMLERKFPEKYGRKDKVDLKHDGKIEADVDIDEEDKEILKGVFREFITRASYGARESVRGDDSEADGEA